MSITYPTLEQPCRCGHPVGGHNDGVCDACHNQCWGSPYRLVPREVTTLYVSTSSVPMDSIRVDDSRTYSVSLHWDADRCAACHRVTRPRRPYVTCGECGHTWGVFGFVWACWRNGQRVRPWMMACPCCGHDLR